MTLKKKNPSQQHTTQNNATKRRKERRQEKEKDRTDRKNMYLLNSVFCSLPPSCSVGLCRRVCWLSLFPVSHPMHNDPLRHSSRCGSPAPPASSHATHTHSHAHTWLRQLQPSMASRAVSHSCNPPRHHSKVKRHNNNDDAHTIQATP